jgi:Xaa-Pro aminopeptidase
LVTSDREYIVTSNIEAPRMREEETPGIEMVDHPWYEDPEAVLQESTADAPLGADFAAEGVRDISAEVSPLRQVLDPEDIRRYRRVGAKTVEAVEEAASSLEREINEYEAAANPTYSCQKRGLSDPVVLVAADGRIGRYRHPVLRGNAFEQRVMLAVVAEQHGLHVSLTRFVDFEEPDEESKQPQKACDTILVRMREETTRPGRSLAEAFADCQRFCAEEGFSD